MSHESDSVNKSAPPEDFPEDCIYADDWKDMAFEYNVGPTGPYPLPLSGSRGLVRSVRIHNAIGAYAAIMAREDALNEETPKSSAAKKSKSNNKAPVPKGPTRSSARNSATTHPAIAVTSGAPTAPVAPAAAAAAQRVTRSSARQSSTLNSGVTATSRAPPTFIAPAPPTSGAHISPVAHAAGAQRVTRSSVRQSSTLNSGLTGAPSAPPSKATLVAPAPTAAATSATRVPVAKGSKIKIYQTPALVPPGPSVAAPPASSKLRLVLRQSDSDIERSTNSIVSQNGARTVIQKNEEPKTVKKKIKLIGRPINPSDRAETLEETLRWVARNKRKREEQEAESARQAKMPRPDHQTLFQSTDGERPIRRQSI